MNQKNRRHSLRTWGLVIVGARRGGGASGPPSRPRKPGEKRVRGHLQSLFGKGAHHGDGPRGGAASRDGERQQARPTGRSTSATIARPVPNHFRMAETPRQREAPLADDSFFLCRCVFFARGHGGALFDRTKDVPDLARNFGGHE